MGISNLKEIEIKALQVSSDLGNEINNGETREELRENASRQGMRAAELETKQKTWEMAKSLINLLG